MESDISTKGGLAMRKWHAILAIVLISVSMSACAILVPVAPIGGGAGETEHGD